jgi:hypothetical protein
MALGGSKIKVEFVSNHGKGDEIEIEFIHNIFIPKKLNSLKDLSYFKDIEKSIVCEFLQSFEGKYYVRPGNDKFIITMFSKDDFSKIKTIVNRDNIITKILDKS